MLDNFLTFLMVSELHIMEIRLYGTLIGQALWKFLLDLSKKASIESSSYYIRLSAFHIRKGQ